VPEWIGELKKDQPVAVFCAYGFHVAARTTLALREAGFDAKVVPGGRSAWKAIGGPTKQESLKLRWPSISPLEDAMRKLAALAAILVATPRRARRAEHRGGQGESGPGLRRLPRE
jgi:3-mercaptopyruvate sulfurtransferase SseA